jgi:hypothetical protein
MFGAIDGDDLPEGAEGFAGERLDGDGPVHGRARVFRF